VVGQAARQDAHEVHRRLQDGPWPRPGQLAHARLAQQLQVAVEPQVIVVEAVPLDQRQRPPDQRPAALQVELDRLAPLAHPRQQVVERQQPDPIVRRRVVKFVVMQHQPVGARVEVNVALAPLNLRRQELPDVRLVVQPVPDQPHIRRQVALGDQIGQAVGVAGKGARRERTLARRAVKRRVQQQNLARLVVCRDRRQRLRRAIQHGDDAPARRLERAHARCPGRRLIARPAVRAQMQARVLELDAIRRAQRVERGQHRRALGPWPRRDQPHRAAQPRLQPAHRLQRARIRAQRRAERAPPVNQRAVRVEDDHQPVARMLLARALAMGRQRGHPVGHRRVLPPCSARENQRKKTSPQRVYGKLRVSPSSPSPFSLRGEKGSRTRHFPSPR